MRYTLLNKQVRSLTFRPRNPRMLSLSISLCASLLFASTILQATGEIAGKGNTKSIQCYVCNSYNDPRCGDPINPAVFELVHCNQFLQRNSFVCRKKAQTVILGNITDRRVTRTCGYLPDPSGNIGSPNDDDAMSDSSVESNRCYNKADNFVQMTYCSCHTDGCAVTTPQDRNSTALSQHRNTHAQLLLSLSKPFYGMFA